MRYYSSVAPELTLVGGITDSDLSMQVSAVTGLPVQTPFTLVVDVDQSTEEIVTVTAIAGTTLTITRGEDGSSAVAHSSGATVRHMATARDYLEPQQHAAATTGVHGLAAGVEVVGRTATQTLTNKTLSGVSNTFASIPQSAVTDLETDIAALDTGKADATHVHSAADVTTGTLPIARGGTGATTASAALGTLGAAAASHTHDDRYYTETEVDTALATKAASTHAHAASDVTSGTFDQARMPAELPYAMAAGTVTVSVSASNSASAAVTFPAGRFTQSPIVTVSQMALPAGSGHLIAKGTGVSASGFSAYVYTGDNTTTTASVTLHWTAVQMTSSSGAG